jgi:hypothetical protein
MIRNLTALLRLKQRDSQSTNSVALHEDRVMTMEPRFAARSL